MAWDNSRPIDPLGPPGSLIPDRFETIEIVGPHLRVVGEISLLRFNRLSDLLNHNRGFVKLNDAQLLRRNGDPTDLVVPELMVNQDEITFVGQKEAHVAAPDQGMTGAPNGLIGGSSEGSGLIGGSSERLMGSTAGFGPMDRPMMERVPREVVIFTEGHTLLGKIHLFSETDIETFVDSPDPRFIPLVDVRARSLADRRVISHFALALVNRTQILAAALREFAGNTDETGVGVD